jgi:RNA polymerase sigma-70 factor (ECF subfamily)
MAGAEGPLRASLRRFARAVDTEAIVQETLLRMWQVAPRVADDGRPDPLLRLAFVTARNLAIDEARRRRHEVPEDPEAAPPSINPRPPDPLLRRAIRRCIEALPKQPAAALGKRLRSQGATPDRDLAAELGMRLNTFLQNVTRARRLVAECLERAGVALP